MLITITLFDLKYALSSCPGQLLESGVKSERHNAVRCAGAQLIKNREVSFLTLMLGRMTPIGIKKKNLLAQCIKVMYDPNTPQLYHTPPPGGVRM